MARTVSAQFVTNACLIVLTTIAVTSTLMYLKALMVPFVLAVFIFFMLGPTLSFLQTRLRVPHSVALFLAFGSAAVFTTALILVISNSIRKLVANVDLYKDRTAELLLAFGGLLERYGLSADLSSLREDVQTAQVFEILSQFTGEFLGVVGNMALIFVYLLFLLSGRDSVPSTGPIAEVSLNISRYIWTKFFVSLLTGACVGLFLSIMGLELAFMFGVLAYMLNFIPSVGSLVATLLPIPVALIQFGMGVNTLVVVIVLGLIQFLVGNVLEPKIMGQRMDLHPVTIMFFLLFWGVVWGVPGMFLAVPITAVLKFILEKFAQTKSLADLLAGRVTFG